MSLANNSERNNVKKIFEVMGNYLGYDYVVTLDDTGLREGYVKISTSVSNDIINDIEFYGNFVYLGSGGEDIPYLHACYPICKSNYRWIGFGDGTVRDYNSTASSFGRIEHTDIMCDIEDIRYTQFFIGECKRIIDTLTQNNTHEEVGDNGYLNQSKPSDKHTLDITDYDIYTTNVWIH